MWKPVEIRRKDRIMTEERGAALLQEAEWGVLASASGEGLPLATPLSFVMIEGTLYFHCALKGHKLDNISAQPRVSFCVVGSTQPIYDGDFTTYYESVVLHGRASLVADGDEKRQALMALCEKYLPAHMDKAPGDIERSNRATAVVRIDIDQMTGKAKAAGKA